MDRLTEYILVKEASYIREMSKENTQCASKCMKMTKYYKMLGLSLLTGPFAFIPFAVWLSGKHGAGFVMCSAKCHIDYWQQKIKSEKDPKKRAKLQKRLQHSQKEYKDYEDRLKGMLKKAKQKNNAKAIALITKYLKEIKRL